MLTQLTEQYSVSCTSLRGQRPQKVIQQQHQISMLGQQSVTLSAPTLPTNPFALQVDRLVQASLQDATEESSEALWDTMLLTEEKKVYIHKQNDNCVKLVANLKGSAASAFDLFYDICEQPLWATISDQTDIVQVLDPYTRIIYCKLKALWPTSTRDIVFISHIRAIFGRW